MADGYLVRVVMERPQQPGGPLPPMVETWFAHISGEKAAIHAVRKASGAGAETKVEIVHPLSHDFLAEHNILENDVQLEERSTDP